jgi:hypothetical protein
LSITPSIAAPDGLLFFSHAGDDRKTCREYILRRLGQPLRHEAIKANPGKSDRAIAADLGIGNKTVSRARNSLVSDDTPDEARIGRDGKSYQGADRSAHAAEIWKAAVDPRGTIVERYLAGRGLKLHADVAGRVVRFHSACPFGRGRQPCMVTVFRSIADDSLRAIHRTALTYDGKKIDRMMLGPVAGAAIKVDADIDVEQGLAIGEGFETCLAGRMLGFRPVWAVGSAGAIGTFPVLPGIEALTILAETDDSGANARAVEACAERWSGAGHEVLVATPRVAGDLNDALVA